MANFLFVYRQNPDTFRSMPPEEMQQHMKKWQVWISEGLQKGWMVSPGDALKREGRIVKDKQLVTDGPFVEAKEIVGGFSIVTAANLDAAAELAKGCPCVIASGGTVEVRPLEGINMNDW